jgi:type IV pilus assembly protein PilW
VISSRRQNGTTLVELMISLTLGLLVTGAALTMFISNRQTYAATENLGRMQESLRVTFELMARDLREAGGTPCARDLPIVNVLNTPTAAWWAQWTAPMTGYGGSAAFPGAPFGNGVGERLAGTDALEIHSALDGVAIAEHRPDSARFKLNTADHGLDDGDIAVACDFDHAAIFQVTSAQPGINDIVVHNTGVGTPGNASDCLALNGVCPNGPVKTYAFGCFLGQRQGSHCVDPRNWPARIAKLEARRWFVANNGRGGRSLYRTGLRTASGTPGSQAIEVAENVTGLQLGYLLEGASDYVGAEAVSSWANVVAIRIDLRIFSVNPVGTDAAPLQRTARHIVTLRNRTS